jgi:hypothetical protein
MTRRFENFPIWGDHTLVGSLLILLFNVNWKGVRVIFILQQDNN